MMFIAVIVGIFTGNIDAVTEAAISMSKTAVEIAIGLIGIMALWLGTMKIAEESGLIRILSKAIRPITIRLFPDVPEDHPAIGSIVLGNMAANILGLGNAATPNQIFITTILGLKAMEELQELNPKKDTATNAMCVLFFQAINTSSVQFILPATVVEQYGPESLWALLQIRSSLLPYWQLVCQQLQQFSRLSFWKN